MGENDGHSSIKLHNPPGGRSNFNIFGGDDHSHVQPSYSKVTSQQRGSNFANG